MCAVGLHRAHAQVHELRHLGVRVAQREQADDLAFTVRERICGRRGRCLDHRCSERRVQVSLAAADRLDRGHEFVFGGVLDEVALGAGGERAFHPFGLVVHAEHEDPAAAALRLERLHQVEAVGVGQGDVEHDHVRALDLDELHGVLGGARLPAHGDAVRMLEDAAKARANDRVVVDEEHLGVWSGIGHAASLPNRTDGQDDRVKQHLEHLETLAEAGISLALARDAQHCCELLRDWTARLVSTETIGVTYSGELGTIAIGTLPDGIGADAAPQGGGTPSTNGWHVVDIAHPDVDESSWTSQLWFAEPADDHWRVTTGVLARQAGVGLARVLRRSELTRHERAQQALVEAGKALSSERTLDGVLRLIVEHAMELTGARYGALGVLDDKSEGLAAFVTVGIDEHTQELIGDLPRGRGILGVLIDDPRPLRLRRLQDHPKSAGFPDHHPPMGSFLGVPIVTSRGVAGRIYLTEKQGAPEFTADDEQLVETLASQAAIAIYNAALNDELARTAAELREASRHKSAFLANMSHELRSPLNTIIGYTRLLLEDPRELDSEQLEDLEIVRSSSEHLLALITDLLDLQRIEAGRVSLALADEDLSALVGAVIASIRPSVADGVELVADVSALADPVVRCDRTRIRQVLLNVLGNAIKFTEQGSVELVVRDDGGSNRVVVEVRDTGPGIPEDDQRRIFDSFFQSQAAIGRTPDRREGAGLGLAITKMLVDLHGGDVHLDSTLGSGTTVTIELPRDAASAVDT
ncbi:MAG: putative two-component system sensor kinase [Thermoleophilia bacterium]|nr:putative two-component system sensor kinase [Thermoleophilia bacterium]